MATHPGTIQIERMDGTLETLSMVNTTAAGVIFDAAGFRGPYGDTWHVSGTKKRGPESFTFTIETSDGVDGINTAAQIDLPALLAALRDAAIIDTPLGVIVPVAAGPLSVVTSPLALGYRVDVTIAARTGRLPDDSSVLRFISGPVWSLR